MALLLVYSGRNSRYTAESTDSINNRLVRLVGITRQNYGITLEFVHLGDSILSTYAVGPLSHGGSAVITLTVTVPQDAAW